MPCKDGTGPGGQGPMTGHSGGDCVLKESEKHPGCFVGYVGAQGSRRFVEIKLGTLFDLFAPLLVDDENETKSQ